MRKDTGSGQKADKCRSTLRTTTIFLTLSVWVAAVTPARAEIIEQGVIEGYMATVSADLMPGFVRTPVEQPGLTAFSYQGDRECAFGFSQLRTDAEALRLPLNELLLYEFQAVQARGIALSNLTRPQSISHGTSMSLGYATVTSNGSTLVRIVAQGPSGGRISGSFNCPRGGPQMANVAAGALQTLTVSLQQATGVSPYGGSSTGYGFPNTSLENTDRLNSLNGSFISNFQSRQKGW